MEGISGGHLIHPVTQAGSPRALFPGQHPGTLEYLQEQRFSTSWAVTESRKSPSQLKVLPHTLREHPVLPFVPITSGPTTGHHWKEPGSLLLAPSFKVIIHIQKMLPSFLFSRLNSPSSLILSMHDRSSKSLFIFVVLH